MQTDVNNVLSGLMTLSDTADQILLVSNFGDDQVGQWFSIIKETAVAIAKGTYCRNESSSFSKDDLPSLVTLVKGKQNSHRVSALLAVQKDNRARLSHRKSRKSLRKIILGKKSGNQWEISNRESSIKGNENKQVDGKSTIPIPKDKLLESRSPLDISSNKSLHSKSYFSELNSSCKRTPRIDLSTPIRQNKEIIVSNTNETPVTRFRSKLSVEATEVVKVTEREIQFSSQSSLPETKTSVECNTSEKARPLLVKSNYGVAMESSVSQADTFLTPVNKTITVDSDDSADKNNFKTPLTRSKRKSSVQHTQENAKKIKCATTISQVLTGKHAKWDDNSTGNKPFKQIKLAKDMNSVIPAKNLPLQNHQPHPEKRILKEIQKKEEKVSQNARKLRSLQKMKIEENKKAREKKMEKAMQQRMKIEKEKEERIRSRTQSKQENLQQTEPAPKKAALQKAELVAVAKNPSKSQHEDKSETSRKPFRSPVKKNKVSPVKQKSPKHAKNVEVDEKHLHDPSSKERMNTNLLNALNATYIHSPANESNSTPPPKPARNAKKANETSSEKNAQTSTYSSNSACPAKDGHLSSTPAAKKVESKTNLAKTPVSNIAKKPNSYAMTPHESSYVSYDISAIKSDDSDDEENSTHHKPIPTWASGFNLRTALLKQHYAPIDVNDLFGNVFEPPQLSEIMGIEKRHYYKRTSSAIWLDSPNRSRLY